MDVFKFTEDARVSMVSVNYDVKRLLQRILFHYQTNLSKDSEVLSKNEDG